MRACACAVRIAYDGLQVSIARIHYSLGDDAEEIYAVGSAGLEDEAGSLLYAVFATER